MPVAILLERRRSNSGNWEQEQTMEHRHSANPEAKWAFFH